MTIKEMYDTVRSLINEGQGGYFSPDDIVRALNMGSSDKFNEERRLFQDTSHISENLRNFTLNATVTITTGSGPLPSGYGYRTNVSNTSNGMPVEIVSEGDYPERISDPIDPPSIKYPICRISGSTINVYPTSITGITLYYLRLPVTMTLAYSTDSNGVYTINEGSSVSCDWPAECHDDIILRGLPYLGVPLSDDLVIKLKSFKRGTEGV